MKKIIIFLISILSLLWVGSFFSGYTQVVYVSSHKTHDNLFEKHYVKGDTLLLLDGIDFTQGSWTAYLIIDEVDAGSLAPELRKANCYKTEDINLLKHMQQDWKVVLTGGDMSTVQSKLIFSKNGKVEFTSGIVIDKTREGLQSDKFGWAEAVDKRILSEYCKKFKRVYYPFLFL